MSRQKSSQRSRPVSRDVSRKGPPAPVARQARFEEPAPRRAWRPLALGAICLAGIGVSIYLLIVHYEPRALICGQAGVVDCQQVLTSPSSVIFHIPVPYFGLVYFVAMGAICLPFACCNMDEVARNLREGAQGQGWQRAEAAGTPPPEMLGKFLAFYGSVGKSLDRRVYETVYIRISAMNGCNY